MNYFSVPTIYGLFFMPAITVPFQSTASLQPPTEGQSKSDILLSLEESERELHQFVRSLEDLTDEPLSPRRLQISEKGNERLLESFPSLEQILGYALERYKQNYRQDQRKCSWGRYDCQLFLWVLDKYCLLHGKSPEDFEVSDWARVSRMVPFRSGHSCMFKWLSLRKQKLEEFPWLPEEEEFLFSIADPNDRNDWVQISRELFNKFSRCYRSPKQCREHWSLHLNSLYDRAKQAGPYFRKMWSQEEDLRLMQSFQARGRRWKEISRELVGRSENAIKNRFTLITKKYGGDLSDHSLTKRTAIIVQRLTEIVAKGEQSQEQYLEKLEQLERSSSVKGSSLPSA